MMENFEPPDWLIDGILQRRFVYSLTGQTGHAKTAVALLLAELIARNDLDNPKLGPHSVSKGKVVYMVGENPDDVTMRLIGADSLRDYTGDNSPLDDRIWFVPGVFHIGQFYGQLANHCTQIGGIDLIIVDTSAAYFPGSDENLNTEIGDHARMLRALTTLPGEPTVLVLCHPVKYVTDVAQLLPRGGGAFIAEMDGNLTLRRIGDGVATMVELHHNKIRGPGFDPMVFRLEKITCEKLHDNTGKLIPTVHAVLVTDYEVEKEQNRATDDEDRVMIEGLADPDVSIAEMAERCGWHFANGDPAKSRVVRALERLEKDHMVKKIRGKFELTEAGKIAARKAALRTAPRTG
jgi:hypothetical protein